jgi:hypothetical protein
MCTEKHTNGLPGVHIVTVTERFMTSVQQQPVVVIERLRQLDPLSCVFKPRILFLPIQRFGRARTAQLRPFSALSGATAQVGNFGECGP